MQVQISKENLKGLQEIFYLLVSYENMYNNKENIMLSIKESLQLVYFTTSHIKII